MSHRAKCPVCGAQGPLTVLRYEVGMVVGKLSFHYEERRARCPNCNMLIEDPELERENKAAQNTAYNYAALGLFFSTKRNEQKLSIAELAARTSLPVYVIQTLEDGKSDALTVANIWAVAEALNLHIQMWSDNNRTLNIGQCVSENNSSYTRHIATIPANF